MMTARLAVLVTISLAILCSVSDAGMKRVAKRYYAVSLFGGYSKPVGQVNGIGGHVFHKDLDTDFLYNPSYHIGFSYETLRKGHLQYGIGFRYTKNNDVEYDTIFIDQTRYYYEGDVEPSFNQYDIQFDLNYLPMKIAEASVTPYFGIGCLAGVQIMTARGYTNEGHVNLAFSANFGGEVKIYTGARGRDFVTLASINSYQFWASGDRPRQFNIGGALKYYFRP